MSLKSSILAIAALLLMLAQGAVANAATITRDTTTGSTPNGSDFPPAYNNHPSQVSYRPNTAINVGQNTMFRETIPVVCSEGQRLASIGLTFRVMKLSNGPNAGNNDTMNFWVNGQNRYELNIGAAATRGSPVTISLDLGALPPIRSGPNTVTAVHTSLPGTSPSMIPDIRTTKRLSFAVQDDTNINSATVNYACENDPDLVPPAPTQPFAVNSCCPPWNPALLGNSLQYAGSGSINSSYTLRFAPSAGLISSLQAYLNYINSTDSSLTKLNIEFQLYDQGTGNWPPLPPGNNGVAVGPPSGLTLTANSTNSQLHTNYNTNTPAIYTGVSTPGTITTPSSFPMQVGRWYMVHTGMWTDTGEFFDASVCANIDVYVRISFMPAARRRAPVAVLELRNSNGTVSRTIPLDRPNPLPIQLRPDR